MYLNFVKGYSPSDKIVIVYGRWRERIMRNIYMRMERLPAGSITGKGGDKNMLLVMAYRNVSL
jgi:hypothetical protein